MSGSKILRFFTAVYFLLAGGIAAFAQNFNIPGGDLKSALDVYAIQSGLQLMYGDRQIEGVQTKGAKGALSPEAALSNILRGTGFEMRHDASGAIAIVRDERAVNETGLLKEAAAPAPSAPGAALETVTVTSSKIGGDVQNIPISITALSQEQLTATQTAGGPDLIKQVPNMTFTKTNFSGYSIQLRGIGTQAISVTTDPAVAVAFNDIPFIRNHFFEQEFYDVSQVEVLRGPQGTLYGRNATAGVVNLVSARPTDQFEAMASADVGNYQNRRLEAMINIPIVDDRLDIRVAGEWTKRQGYSFNETDDNRIDGRDLWSGRVTLGWKPSADIQTYLIWEHFSEDDDRMRSAKQLCKTDYGPGGTPTNGTVDIDGDIKGIGPGYVHVGGDYFTQGCAPASLYSTESYQAPLGFTLPYILGIQDTGNGNPINPYASETQSHNLRVVDSGLDPSYRAKNDVVEFNADYNITPTLTFTSQTGFGHDFLYSAEDYNRFGAAPGIFEYSGLGASQPGGPQYNGVAADPSGLQICDTPTDECAGLPIGSPCSSPVKHDGVQGCVLAGYFCDPQLGCSDRLIAEDLSQEHAWQLSQEFRVTSNFSGPLNFSAGGNYLHYETEENYYVFSNVFTVIDGGYVPGKYDSNSDNPLPFGFQFDDPTKPSPNGDASGYVDPNPLSHLNNNGHNYFLSQNPYVLNSYAAFGEANYSIFSDLKLTAGLRWTEDQKHFSLIPSWLIAAGWGYPVAGVVNQQWDQLTGRAVANWTPKLNFTDQTLVYGSYAHGYKAGGTNPPGAIFSSQTFSSQGVTEDVQPTHPLTFKPEFIDAFEVGTKNTLLDGALTLNGDLFYYNYENYQVSQIVDRTAVNLNFDAHAKGAELEATWEPSPGLRFNFAGGWEDTALAKGDQAIDLMDRTAGTPGWYVVKPFVNEASNCIFPGYVAKEINQGSANVSATAVSYCAFAYELHDDPLTGLPYKANPTDSQNPLPPGYIGFDPSTAPNDGAGFSKNLGGNSLPNAPPYTVSVGAQYTVPLTSDWAGTARADFYWQDSSWWRVFNDLSYDRLKGYDTVNITFILTSQTGWQVMLYDKNIFNTTAITGAFLNSDDSGLTTNVFLTDPKLIGIRVTKNW
jgi:outer membrane receptor protein involved in Fe transport